MEAARHLTSSPHLGMPGQAPVVNVTQRQHPPRDGTLFFCPSPPKSTAIHMTTRKRHAPGDEQLLAAGASHPSHWSVAGGSPGVRRHSGGLVVCCAPSARVTARRLPCGQLALPCFARVVMMSSRRGGIIVDSDWGRKGGIGGRRRRLTPTREDG